MKGMGTVSLFLTLTIIFNIFYFLPTDIKATTTGTTINVPGDFSTIQAGINAAIPGDTVQVAGGTYYERITLKDGVALIGAGADISLIDGGNSGRVVTVSNLTKQTKLEGFTITHGLSLSGGGMHAEYCYSFLTVSNCIFSNNTATSDGGGISIWYSSSPTLTNCAFWNNTANLYGGGICNVFNSSPTITNCSFSNNTATDGGGIYNIFSPSPIVTNCILWGNGEEIYSDTGSLSGITYSDIKGGYSGEGNINQDPQFVNPENGNFRLQPGSPCIDTGTNDAESLPATDISGQPRTMYGGMHGSTLEPITDMGIFENSVPDPAVPELPAGLLLGIGVSGVGGFILIKRRTRRYNCR